MYHRAILIGQILIIGLLTATFAAAGESGQTSPENRGWKVIMQPDNSYGFFLLKDGRQWGTISIGMHRTGWQWAGTTVKGFAQDGVLDVGSPFVTVQKPDQSIAFRQVVKKTAPNTITFTYTLSADTEQKVTRLTPSVSCNGELTGTLDLYKADGTQEPEQRIPAFANQLKDKSPVGKMVWKLKDIGEVAVTMEPPLIPTPSLYGGSAIMSTPFLFQNNPDKGVFPAGTKTYTMTLTFPDKVDFVADKEGMGKLTGHLADESWYALPATGTNTGPSVIGMENWLDAPAGKHGIMKRAGDRFEFADGTPVKLWGFNVCASSVYPEKKRAEVAAARYAKLGVNCLRFNQFVNSWGGFCDPNDSTKFDAKKLDQMDYYVAKLKEHGIYYTWMHTWNFAMHPADKPKLLAYDEIMKNLPKGNTYGLIQVAPDVQDLEIEMLTNLLKHKNPYTGLTYAEDPALAYLEVMNEDNIFFWSMGGALEKCPTYKRKFEERYAAWLKEKYKTPEAWRAAWGNKDAKAEIGDAMSMELNPWQLSTQGLATKRNNPGAMTRALDGAQFLYGEQIGYYTKVIKAAQAAGYKGPWTGSGWFAAPLVPQYMALKANTVCGHVDYHNYFAGGADMFTSMLTHPGSGILSSGLQQVSGHTFGISEWTQVYPNVYAAEGVAIVATYGMGLQGWDSSFQFQSVSGAGYEPLVGTEGYGVWNGEQPSQIGQYPALARMIHRGDVKEGETITTRRVSDKNLQTGVFDFDEAIAIGGDVKSITSTVPLEAMAAGKVLVEFAGDKEAPTTLPDMSKFKLADKVVQSNTKQLVWDYSGKGFILINTPGTKGVVGFTPDTPHKMDNVTVTVHNPFASVLITAIEKDKTLADCKHALVSVIARASNTGFSFFSLNNKIIDNGKAPILLEPIKARIAIAGRRIAAVNALDFDGVLQPNKTVKVDNKGEFAIDTGVDHTMYYEVVFQ